MLVFVCVCASVCALGGGGGLHPPPTPAAPAQLRYRPHRSPYVFPIPTRRKPAPTPGTAASTPLAPHHAPSSPSPTGPAMASAAQPTHSTSRAAALLGDWVLDLLTPPSSAAPSSTASRRTPKGKGGGSSLTSEQRGMLGSAAAHHLCGRVLMAGNPVLLPLLGHTLLCCVAAATPTVGEVGAARYAAGQGGSTEAWQVVAGVTRIVLLLEGVWGCWARIWRNLIWGLG